MEHVVAKLLELAADNDVDGFKILAGEIPSCVDETGPWYARQNGASNNMILEDRTPLMVASMYGSVDVVKLILSHFEVDVKKSCGNDDTTALHCAASGGSTNAVEIVELLLAAGANPASSDVNGLRPFDVIAVSPGFQEIKPKLDRLLNLGKMAVSVCTKSESKLTCNKSASIHPVSSSHSDHLNSHSPLPDMRYGLYATDAFRMYKFKVVSCTRASTHDWTECPFMHPGENARRRDPRKFHYAPTPCPEYRLGACDKGDKCQYSHGVFECWLHPNQYRTRVCNEGIHCNRKVCFFAHTRRELRPVRVSGGGSGSGVLSSNNYAASRKLSPGIGSYVPRATSRSPVTPTMSPRVSHIEWRPVKKPIASRVYRPVSLVNGRDTNISSPFGIESPSSKEMLNPFQQQQQPISSPNNYEVRSPMSLNHMNSPRTLTASNLDQQLQPFRCFNPLDFSDLGFSSRDLGFGDLGFGSHDLGSISSPIVGSSSALNWSSSSQKPIWGESAQTSDAGKLKAGSSSTSIQKTGGDDWENPDLSWLDEYIKDNASSGASEDHHGKRPALVSAASGTSMRKPIKVSYIDDPLDPAVLMDLFGQLDKIDEDSDSD